MGEIRLIKKKRKNQNDGEGIVTNVFPQTNKIIFIIMDHTTNILFWISFVGICIFIVNGIYATILSRITKSKDTPQSDKLFNIFLTTMAVLFIALAVNCNIQNQNNINSNQNNTNQYITPPDPYHPFGKVVVYDTVNQEHDTITLYIKEEQN